MSDLIPLPELGEAVTVKEPMNDDDRWIHSFIGTVVDIIKRDGEETTYIIEDQDSDMFEMERDRFTTEDEEEANV
jgi:hypothetical protein